MSNPKLDRLLNTLPSRTPAELAVMEANALARPKDPNAAALLEAIAADRALREAAKPAPTGRAARPVIDLEAVTEAMRDLPAGERILAAFQAKPPTATELAWLRVLHAHPGSTGEELARHAGEKGANSFHLRVGSLCAARSAWLAQDFVPYRDKQWKCVALCAPADREEGGRTLTEWRLKPEAEAALRELGHLSDNA
ncbi:hypothetical protein JMJ55_07055 [Belnapia sp. T6]|uniref:Uncharacterized protein n=1 Tax=Belnapia mucosa TaxID=2804532 RepID=A0ABS1V1T7_9PROT|nr:hypothetical protein [Belnapia mucosa]MBL6455076.1 hypothetical protein [Belnapia mucosa]